MTLTTHVDRAMASPRLVVRSVAVSTRRRLRGLCVAALCLLGGFDVGAAQEAGRAPDGTPLACNFNFSVHGSEPASTDCAQYHIYLARAGGDGLQSTISIAAVGTSDEFTYLVADMPLNEPVLLLDGSRAATRIVARRRSDRVDFTIGVRAFVAPPPRALAPRSSKPSARVRQNSDSESSGQRSESGRQPLPAASQGAGVQAVVGEWQAQGVILTIYSDGTFSRVSHISPGAYGGVPGVDDAGTWHRDGSQLSFKGMLLTRTCAIRNGTDLDCGGTLMRKQ